MRRLLLAPLMSLALLGSPAACAAADDGVVLAQAALKELNSARDQLTAAEGASDRVAALTRVVGAYEVGLSALREGLRQAAIREESLQRWLDSESTQVTQLLAALESLESTPETLLVLHPQGPLGAVRSGMILSQAAPALQARVDELKTRVDDIKVIRTLQESAMGTLEDGLAGVQQARTALSEAISNRTDLPRRYADNSAALALLLDSADTLASFASGLAQLTPPDGMPGPNAYDGPLPLPVNGQVIRQYGERDAAGIARPGLVIATEPRAMVTAPVASTIRYLGPLLDYGNVMILEPDADTLLVLAGLGTVYGAVGQVIPAGTPVGLMGGKAPTEEEFIASSADGVAAERPETLYVELRKGNDPVDPAGWFAGTEDGTE